MRLAMTLRPAAAVSGIVSPMGLLQLLASVVLLSSAWPLTKIAIAAGSTPLWFAEGRAILSALTTGVLLAIMRRVRVPKRGDLPAILANVFLHEPFTLDLLAGSALIMAGVACAAWPGWRTTGRRTR